MSLKRWILQLIGVGHGPSQTPRHIDESEADMIRERINKQIEKHKEVQSDLQCATLNDIDHSLGVRMAVDGVLKKLEKDKPK